MQTIYKPNGRAAEYGEYALNIYQGCPHGCIYCYVPNCLHKERDKFHLAENCIPRKNIVEETAKRLEKGDIKGKYVFLSFTSDPFPVGVDHKVTLDIIDLIHESGNFVQILSKGRIDCNDCRHFISQDKIGVTVSCGNELAYKIEPEAVFPGCRLETLSDVKKFVGCGTFLSCEPVFEPKFIYKLICNANYVDEFKFGKLNYMSPDNPFYPNIDWAIFGHMCEELCKAFGRKYYIKESLRKEMEVK